MASTGKVSPGALNMTKQLASWMAAYTAGPDPGGWSPNSLPCNSAWYRCGGIPGGLDGLIVVAQRLRIYRKHIFAYVHAASAPCGRLFNLTTGTVLATVQCSGLDWCEVNVDTEEEVEIPAGSQIIAQVNRLDGLYVSVLFLGILDPGCDQ